MKLVLYLWSQMWISKEGGDLCLLKSYLKHTPDNTRCQGYVDDGSDEGEQVMCDIYEDGSWYGVKCACGGITR